MFGIIRLVIRIGFLLFAGMLVLAFLTNPDMEEFRREADAQMQKQINTLGDDATLKSIAEMTKELKDDVLNKFVTRKNYYVCSVYEVKFPGGTCSYLGAFHMFFPMQKDNPMDKFILPADNNVF